MACQAWYNVWSLTEKSLEIRGKNWILKKNTVMKNFFFSNFFQSYQAMWILVYLAFTSNYYLYHRKLFFFLSYLKAFFIFSLYFWHFFILMNSTSFNFLLGCFFCSSFSFWFHFEPPSVTCNFLFCFFFFSMVQ